MAIEKGYSPKHQDQEISRILESSQETNCQETIKSIHFHFLDLKIKTSQETIIKTNKISCLDETLRKTHTNGSYNFFEVHLAFN